MDYTGEFTCYIYFHFDFQLYLFSLSLSLSHTRAMRGVDAVLSITTDSDRESLMLFVVRSTASVNN